MPNGMKIAGSHRDSLDEMYAVCVLTQVCPHQALRASFSRKEKR